MKNYVLITLFVFFATWNSFASPVDLKQLPQETNWMIHLDVEKLLNSKGGHFFVSLLDNEKIQARLQLIEESTSINLTKSIKSITLSGIDEKNSNAILQIKGSFDKDRLRAVLQFIAGYKESFYNSHFFIQWQMRIPTGPLNKSLKNIDNIRKLKIKTRPGTSYACFYNNEMIIIGQSRKAVERSIDVLAGKAQSLASAKEKLSADLFSKENILSSFAVKINKFKDSYPRSAILRQIYSVHMSLFEEGESITNIVDIKIGDEQAAEQIMDIIKGARALALLSAEENPWLSAAARNILINSEGKNIRLTFKASLKNIMDKLKKNLNLTLLQDNNSSKVF